ncbi:MAG: helix-turn-helix domain-containing protein [Bacteroidota bacterium]
MEPIARHTISDLYQTIGLPHDQEVNFTILSVPDIHEQIPFKSPVLRADYFSFILTKKGAGAYYLDDHRFPFGDRSFYFTNPGHVKSYELDESEVAFIVMITESFLRENVHPEIYGEFPFLLAEIVPPHEQSPDDFEEYQHHFDQILHEFNKESQYKNKILGNLLLVLLLKIKEKFWANYDPITEGKGNSRIVKAFKETLESVFKSILNGEQDEIKLQAQYIAEQLNLHPNYLNSVIKSKTGRTVNDWISKRMLSVAKSLLVDTTYSSKEIAYLLGYSEPTHFSRFFKKHTNLSPLTFRKSHGLA